MWLSPFFWYEIKAILQPLGDIAEITQVMLVLCVKHIICMNYAKQSVFHHYSIPRVSGVLTKSWTPLILNKDLSFWKKGNNSKDVCKTGNIMYNLFSQYTLEINRTVQFSPILQVFNFLWNCWSKPKWVQILLKIYAFRLETVERLKRLLGCVQIKTQTHLLLSL